PWKGKWPGFTRNLRTPCTSSSIPPSKEENRPKKDRSLRRPAMEWKVQKNDRRGLRPQLADQDIGIKKCEFAQDLSPHFFLMISAKSFFALRSFTLTLPRGSPSSTAISA